MYGLAPEDVAGTMRQRLRWAIGSLQIMFQDPPLVKPGLSLSQRIVLFQSQFQYLLAIPLIVIILAPLLYLFFYISPISLENGIEFLVLFVSYYWLNRWMLYLAAAHHVDSLEIWRGSQQYIYMVPNNVVAILKVIGKTMIAKKDIAFAVTEKKKITKVTSTEREMEYKKSLIWTSLTKLQPQIIVVWPFLLYVAVSIGGAIYNVVKFANSDFDLTQGKLLQTSILNKLSSVTSLSPQPC